MLEPPGFKWGENIAYDISLKKPFLVIVIEDIENPKNNYAGELAVLEGVTINLTLCITQLFDETAVLHTTVLRIIKYIKWHPDQSQLLSIL